MTKDKAEAIVAETDREKELYFKGKYEVEKKWNKRILIALLIILGIIIFLLAGSFVLALTDKPVEVKNENTNLQAITK